MSYSQFTLNDLKQQFGIRTVEGARVLPDLEPAAVGDLLSSILEENLPLAIATSEKARSELLISPVLVDVWRHLQQQVSLFSGEDFTVDPEQGLSGTCDFLLSRSTEQIEIEAPVVIIIEAKKGDLKVGLGRCIAEMVAAQQFNQQSRQPIMTIYGAVSSGTSWRFLKLDGANTSTALSVTRSDSDPSFSSPESSTTSTDSEALVETAR